MKRCLKRGKVESVDIFREESKMGEGRSAGSSSLKSEGRVLSEGSQEGEVEARHAVEAVSGRHGCCG